MYELLEKHTYGQILLSSYSASYINKKQEEQLRKEEKKAESGSSSSQPSYPPKVSQKKKNKPFKDMTAQEAYEFMGISQEQFEKEANRQHGVIKESRG